MMKTFAGLLSLVFVISQTVSAQKRFLPFASSQDLQAVSRSPRSLLLPSRNGAVIDIAVPEEQRLYGRDLRADLQKRPSGYVPQSLQSYLDAYKPPKYRKIPPSYDTAQEFSISDQAASSFSAAAASHRSSSSAIRRDVKIEPRCPFDAEKWALHMESSLSYAVMFDRKTGGSCTDCLERCMDHQGGAWTCRSVVYDNNWRICDMFAITGAIAPFTLVEYEGRDYYEYLVALPPSDDELTDASKFAMQERANSNNKTSESCQVANPEKKLVVRSKKENQETYGAKPIEEQLKKDEQEAERKEKERRKKANKLQKIAKEEELATISPPVTDVQAAVTGDIVLESRTLSPEEETTTMTSPEEAPTTEGTTESSSWYEGLSRSEPAMASTPETERTTYSTVETVRRKPARKSKAERAELREAVGSETEKQEEKAGNGTGDKHDRKAGLPKRRKVLRRKPGKPSTEEISTAESSQKLSPDIARMKIEKYQHRKAMASTPLPRRRVIRLHGLPLSTAADDELFFQDKVPQDKPTKTRHEGGGKNAAKIAVLQPSEERKPGKKTVKQPRSRRILKNRRTKTTETSTSTTSQATTTTPEMTTTPAMTTTSVAAQVALRPDTEALRMALRREIRKFVSMELKQKGFRVHGTKISGGVEPVNEPNLAIPATKTKSYHTDDISLEVFDSTNACDRNEHAVMLSFPSSTRKPYTAAVETVKARDHRECLEQCETNYDCSSAVFSGSMCEMSTTRARHSVPDIRPATNETYIEKACVDKMLVKGRSTHLTGVANHILAGFVEQVEDVYGIEQCIAACYAALKRYGFQCMSAMWYPMDKEQNCLLNSETMKTRPNLFISEDTGHMMVYFEHPDALFMRRFHDDVSTSKVSKAPELWTAWSTCNGNKEKSRYQKCSQYHDIRKCPKQSAACSSAPYAQQSEKPNKSRSG